ncbi:hypothetical protein VNO77_03261 [Canavalia gladiata]|uniref:Uncharacterized protein n=1 Tax=Canavalia gladiata TaxID=3824 RepID=A0AAN9MZD0_CANGL
MQGSVAPLRLSQETLNTPFFLDLAGVRLQTTDLLKLDLLDENSFIQRTLIRCCDGSVLFSNQLLAHHPEHRMLHRVCLPDSKSKEVVTIVIGRCCSCNSSKDEWFKFSKMSLGSLSKATDLLRSSLLVSVDGARLHGDCS